MDRVSPPMMDRVSPPMMDRVSPPIIDRVSPPMMDRVSPPMIDRVSPPMMDRVSPPIIDRVSPPIMDRVSPPIIDRVSPPMMDRVSPPIIDRVSPPTMDLVSPPIIARLSLSPIAANTGNAKIPKAKLAKGSLLGATVALRSLISRLLQRLDLCYCSAPCSGAINFFVLVVLYNFSRLANQTLISQDLLKVPCVSLVAHVVVNSNSCMNYLFFLRIRDWQFGQPVIKLF